MRMRSALRRFSHWAVLLGPVLLLGLAFGADSVGLDSDQKWGPIRVGMVAASLTAIGLFISWKAVVLLEARQRARNRLIGCAESDAMAIPVPLKPEATLAEGSRLSNRGPWGRIALIVLFGGIELTYVFLVSVGQWTKWPRTTQYYDLLAQSFIRGAVSLPIEPSPLLAELENPYDPVARRDIPILFDASYFRGKYYVYWGPAPAIVVSLWKVATGISLGDVHVLFAASNIALTFSTLIVLRLRRMFFPSLPIGLLLASIALIATAHPVLWVFNTPKIYEAAIASGQAFLLGGLYFAIPAIMGCRQRIWRLSLVGVFWTFALGSRLSLTPAVALMCFAVLKGRSPRSTERPGWQDPFVKSAALLLPVVTGMALLGLYNYARFGDVLETGLQFQLSVVDYRFVVGEGGAFNLRYFLPNVAYYILAPVTLQSNFPFISPLWGTLPAVSSLLQGVGVPSVYHVENISGLLFSVPAVPLTVFLTYVVTRAQSRRGVPSHGGLPREVGLLREPRVKRLLLVMMLAGLGAALPTLLYYWVSNRFLLDSVPMLSITITVLGWAAYESSRITAARRTYAASLLVLGVGFSLLISFLLALTGARSQFDDINPIVWGFLDGLFTR
jgi:hypothetical protein